MDGAIRHFSEIWKKKHVDPFGLTTESLQSAMKTRSFQLEQGRLTEIPPKPEGSAEESGKNLERFGPDGVDRLFQKTRERFTQELKRKSLQPA